VNQATLAWSNVQVMATYLLQPLASSRLMLILRSLLATIATLTFTIALITGIISRHGFFSFNPNSGGFINSYVES
jgi:hypothetical protein